jgi:hypothetical protein
MQRGYRYALTAAMGRNFDPDFRPELTPKEMLTLGVFCGKYMTDCRAEFPATWFERARLSPTRRDCSLNYFGVDASQTLSVWREKGWIHPDDPRGWLQWYCRYYMGRRMLDEDARQIRRWRSVGTSRRLEGSAIREIRFADRDNDKRCCTGPTTVERFEIGAQSIRAGRGPDAQAKMGAAAGRPSNSKSAVRAITSCPSSRSSSLACISTSFRCSRLRSCRSWSRRSRPKPERTC